MWLPKSMRKGGLWLPQQGLGMAGKMRFMPCATCCTVPPVVCNNCDDATPDEWEVVLDGYANDECSECANLNATYFLAQPDPVDDWCTWYYELPTPICLVAAIKLEVFQYTFTHFWITVRLRDVAGFTLDTFTRHYYEGTKPPCSGASELDLPHVGIPSLDCDCTLATCIVSGL